MSADSGWISYYMCGQDRNGAYPGPYYLFYWIMLIFRDPHISFVFLMLLQRFFAGYFTYRVCREQLNFGALASITAGMLYSLAWFESPMTLYHLLAEPGLPFFLWAGGRLIDRKIGFIKILLSLALGLFFAISNNIFVATPFILGAITIWFIVIDKKSFKQYWLVILSLGLMVLLVNYENAIHTLDVMEDSTRHMVEHSYGSGLNLWIFKNSTLTLFGQLAGSDGSQLALLAAILLLAIPFKAWKSQRFLLFSGLYFGIYFFSEPLTTLLESIPLIEAVAKGYKFSRITILLPFLSALTIAAFLDYLSTNSERESSVDTQKRGMRIPLFLAVLFISAPYLRYLAEEWRMLAGTWVDYRLVIMALGGLVAIAIALALLHLIYNVVKKSDVSSVALSDILKFTPLVLVVLIGFTQVFAPCRKWPRATYQEMYGRKELAELATTFSTNEPFRVATAYAKSNFFHPGYLISYGLETVDGYIAVYSGRYFSYWRRVIDGVLATSEPMKNRFMTWGAQVYLFAPVELGNNRKKEPPKQSFDSLYNLDLLSLANVRYFVSPLEISDARLSLVKPNARESLYIYENVEYLPRWFMTNRCRVFESRETLLDSLAVAGNQALREVVFLERGDSPLSVPSEADSLSYTIKNTGYTSDRLSFDVDCTCEAFMIISNTYSKFWEVSINGVASKIYPVDGVFQGVVVPAGKTEVVFNYTRKFSSL